MWSQSSNPFKDFTVRVIYEDDRPVHLANCHKDVEAKQFVIQLGFIEEEWEGLFFPLKDLPYLEEHEVMHAFGLVDGTEELCLNPIFAYDHEFPEILRITLRNEKRAWASQLDHYLPLEILEKIQLFLTQYLIDYDRELKKRGQEGFF
jgi:hypothetical protein